MNAPEPGFRGILCFDPDQYSVAITDSDGSPEDFVVADSELGFTLI
jgi:hypothetical protein